jgi:inosose dehydratase
MRVGNAPVSWGIFEIAGLSADLPYTRVMDEIAEAGYAGTELGPWSYYPTTAAILKAELDARRLALASAFCPVDLTRAEDYTTAEASALTVAGLLRRLGVAELILADPFRLNRAVVAGRAGPEHELPGAAARAQADGLNRLGARLAERGMRAVFHHHAATYVETPSEIDRLLAWTDPSLVGLCLDTGHAVFGGADPVELVRQWRDRVRYVHLKDVDPAALAAARERGLGYNDGVKAGIFCPLGQGCVDFAAVFTLLREIHYDGWLIVEQDVIADESGQALAPLAAAKISRDFLRQFGV